MSNLPATFEQRVKERITGAIADMIPEEDLTAMVKAQVERFRRVELPELIKNQISAQFTAAIKAEFAKPGYMPVWQQHGSMGASTAVKKIIEENASAVLSSLVGGMVQATIQQMQSNMPRMF